MTADELKKRIGYASAVIDRRYNRDGGSAIELPQQVRSQMEFGHEGRGE
jgi:hypothetical protein